MNYSQQNQGFVPFVKNTETTGSSQPSQEEGQHMPIVPPQYFGQMLSLINMQNIVLQKLIGQQQKLLQGILIKSDNNFVDASPQQHNSSMGSSSTDSVQALNQMRPLRKLQQVSMKKKNKNSLMEIRYESDLSQYSQQKSEIDDIIPEQFKKKINQKDNMSNNQKPTQTKNIIKNYSKSIFNFIKKDYKRKMKVLKHLNISLEEFEDTFLKFKGKIYSISELRELWTLDSSSLAKAFRIFSQEYLQKHALGHIYHSRVVNRAVHVKYRKRLLKILQNPFEFTSLK